MRDPPCDSEGFIRDSGSTISNRKLVFAEKGVALPRKDGAIIETAEDGVAERKEKHLQHKYQEHCKLKKKEGSLYHTFKQTNMSKNNYKNDYKALK